MVAPKRASLDKAEGEFEGLMSSLRQKQGELKAVTDKLDKLNDDLEIKQTEKKVSRFELSYLRVRWAGVRGMVALHTTKPLPGVEFPCSVLNPIFILQFLYLHLTFALRFISYSISCHQLFSA